MTTQPYNLGNAKYIFLHRGEPNVGRWVRFERNLADDFIQSWGRLPQNVQKIRILFEIRYDNRAPDSPEIAGEIYYDDLHLGD